MGRKLCSQVTLIVTSNVIDQVTIQTAGNATDFGDLTTARYGLSAASGTAS